MSFYFSPRAVIDGLVLYLDASNPSSYPGSGNTWFDLTINKINPTLTNGPVFSSNPGYFSFDGVNDFAAIDTSVFNRVNGDSMTVGVWMNPARNGNGYYQDIVVNRGYDNATSGLYNWMLYQHGDDGTISFHGDLQYKGTYIPTLNQWINVTVTVQSNGGGTATSIIYVNGNEVSRVSNYQYRSDTPSHLCIGNGIELGAAKEPYQGAIGIVCIYNKALSVSEVAQNYNALKGRFGL